MCSNHVTVTRLFCRLRKTEMKDNRILVCSSPVSLTQMACVKIAIALWNHQNFTREYGTHYDPSEEFNDFEIDESDDWNDNWTMQMLEKTIFSTRTLLASVNQSLNRLQRLLPSQLLTLVRRHHEPIAKRMEQWITYHHREIFFNIPRKCCYQFLNRISWKCNGHINYIETAKNLIRSPRLSAIEKYRIMCVYCMVDEMENVSPCLFTPEFADRVDVTHHPLIHYWNSKLELVMRNDVTNIPSNESASLNRLVIVNDYVDNRWAIEYFWNRLDEEHRTGVAKRLIARYGVKYQTFLINNLTEIQQQTLFTEMGACITKNYILASSIKADRALSIWKRIHTIVTKEQFWYILDSALVKVYVNKRRWYIIPVVMRLWREVPTHYKLFAATHDNGKLIDTFMAIAENSSENGFEVFMEILKDTKATLNVTKMTQLPRFAKFCEFVMINQRAHSADKFFKFVYPEHEDLVHFKKKLMYSRNVKQRIGELVPLIDVQELKNSVTGYLKDTNSATEYIEKVSTFNDELKKLREHYSATKPVREEHESTECRHLRDTLASATDEEKVQTILSQCGQSLAAAMLLSDRFRQFAVFVDECLVGTDVIEFKMRNIVLHSAIVLPWLVNEQWSILDEYLRICFSGYAVEKVLNECKARILLSHTGMLLCTNNIRAAKFTYDGSGKNYRLFKRMLTTADATVKKDLVQSEPCLEFLTMLLNDGRLRMMAVFLNLCYNTYLPI